VSDVNLADIYQRYRQGLFTLALSVTRCPSRAEDAVHEAFARLCRRPEALCGRAPPNAVAYVFAAVRNAAVGQVRRTPRAADGMELAALLFDLADGPPAHAIEAERARGVAEAVGALTAERREVVILRIYAGLTFSQISAVVGAPLPTVAARYRRALERLRERLESIV